MIKYAWTVEAESVKDIKVLELESPRASFSEVLSQKKSTDKTKSDVTSAVDMEQIKLELK